MNLYLDEKTIKAINDLKSALDSLRELNDEQRMQVIITVFGADALNHANDMYNNYLSQEGR